MKYFIFFLLALATFAGPVPVQVDNQSGDVYSPPGHNLNLPAGTTLDNVPIATGTGAEITVKDDNGVTSTAVSTIDLGKGLDVNLSGSEVDITIYVDEADSATPTLTDTILFGDQSDSGLVKKATFTDIQTLIDTGGSAEITIKEDGGVTSTKVTTIDIGTGLSFTYADPEVDLNITFSEFGSATPTLADSLVITDADDSNNEKLITITQLQALIDTTYTAGTGMDLTGTVFNLNHLGLELLIDPNADRIPWFDDSDNSFEWLTIGSQFGTSGDTLVITTNAVDNALLADMPQATLKGRASGAGTGDPQNLTANQVRTVLNVEDGAAADQSDSEIETAYNNRVSQVSAAEKTAGTETTVRRFSPDDVKDMIVTHGGGGGGGGGSGTMNRVKDNSSQVGGADIVTLDFGLGFGVSESPDTEINIELNLQELADGAGTFELTDRIVFSDDDFAGDERTVTLTNLQTLIDTDTQLTEEQVEDFVGGMVTGNTETGITVTYDDLNGTLNFVVTGGVGDNWGDPVDADIIADADGTRDLGTTLTRFAETYTDALDVTNNILVGGTVDGRDVATDGTKLDSIESGATADQSDSEIETAYNNQVSLVSQAEAEAGVGTTVRRWTAERVKQAIVALETDTDTQLTQEQVEDFVGGMVTGNTETRITVTYDDIAGTINFVVDDMNDDQPDDDSEVPDAITVSAGTVTNSDLTLKQSTTPAPTAEGRVEWDTDNDQLAVGDGASTKIFSPDTALDTEAELESRLTNVTNVYTSNDSNFVGSVEVDLTDNFTWTGDHDFTGGTFTANVARIAGSTYSTVQHSQDVFYSTGQISGGTISDDGDGTITVAAGTGMIRPTASDVAQLMFTDWAAESGANVTLTNNDLNWIYVEYNAGSPRVVANTTKPTDFHTNILLGNVYREGTTLHITSENHIKVADHVGLMTRRLQAVMPFAHESGGAVSEPISLKVAVTQATLWQGLTRTTVAAFDSSVSDTFSYYYQDGIGGWTEVTSQTDIDNTQYDDGDGTLGSLGNNQYGVHWLFRGIDGQAYVVYGRDSYTLTDAQAAEIPGNLPPHFEEHARVFARIIIQKSASSFTLIESAFNATFTASLPTDHGDLLGLGDDDHTQYILHTELDTEAELEAALTNVTNVFTNNDGALDDDDVTAADVGLASPNLDDTDASIEWEDAAGLDADGGVSTGHIGPTELASTSVAPGSYTHTSLTVDADGRITSASSGTDDDQPDNDSEVPDAITVSAGTVTNSDLTLKQSTTPAPTAEGRVEWDTDDNRMAIGDGATTLLFSPDTALDTEAELESRLTNVANVFTNNDGALNDDDVTAADVNAAGGVMETDYDANTVLAANADNTPLALTVATDTILGRTSGNIDDLSGANARSILEVEQGIISATILDPESVHAIDPDVCLRIETTVAITIVEILVMCDADPTTELDWDLYYADTFLGKANQTLIDAIDTTAGTTDIISGFDDATIPAGKSIYVTFAATPDTTITQVAIQIKYTVD